jgi:hypothetical protein
MKINKNLRKMEKRPLNIPMARLWSDSKLPGRHATVADRREGPGARPGHTHRQTNLSIALWR